MSDLIWEVIEKLVCRATVFDRDESMIGGTLERYSEEKFKNLLHETQNSTSNLNNKNSDTNQTDNLIAKNEISSQQFLAPPPPPPPPPPLPFNTSSANEPKNKQNISNTKQSNTNTNLSNSAHSTARNSITCNQIDFSGSNNDNGIKLPQQCVPKPSIKMKPLVWSKIHTNRVVGKQNLWTKFKNEYEKNDFFEYSDEAASVESLNYFQEIEEYFKTCENSRVEVKLKEAETKLWNNSEKVRYFQDFENFKIYLINFCLN